MRLVFPSLSDSTTFTAEHGCCIDFLRPDGLRKLREIEYKQFSGLAGNSESVGFRNSNGGPDIHSHGNANEQDPLLSHDLSNQH